MDTDAGSWRAGAGRTEAALQRRGPHEHKAIHGALEKALDETQRQNGGVCVGRGAPPPPRVHLNKRAVDPRVSIGVRERGRRLRVTQVARTAPTNFPTGLERREPVGVLQPAVPRPARPAVTGRLARKCPLASASARVLLNGAPTAGHSFQTRSSR